MPKNYVETTVQIPPSILENHARPVLMLPTHSGYLLPDLVNLINKIYIIVDSLESGLRRRTRVRILISKGGQLNAGTLRLLSDIPTSFVEY